MTYEEFKQDYEGREFIVSPNYSGIYHSNIGLVGKAVGYTKQPMYFNDIFANRQITLSCVPSLNSIWRTFIYVSPDEIEPVKGKIIPLPLPG